MSRKFDLRTDPEGVQSLGERNARAAIAKKPAKKRRKKKKPLETPAEPPVEETKVEDAPETPTEGAD